MCFAKFFPTSGKSHTVWQVIAAWLSLMFLAHPSSAQNFPEFESVTLDANLGKVCYAVTLADVDGDGSKDIVAVTENRVLWFEAPHWKSHVMLDDQTPKDNVCIAAHDIDGDGKIDFALGAGWTKKGTIHWIKRGESLDDPWTVHFIGEELWLHRMRFADVLGENKPQLVISPLNASVGKGVRLTALSIPADPETDRWVPTVLNQSFNRMHNHWHVDFDQNGTVDTLTASREGIHWITKSKDSWSAIQLAKGVQADKPNDCGAGELKTGTLADGKRFLVAVEPMHGHQVAVYTKTDNADPSSPWTPQVIGKDFVRGHALWTADIDQDGDDEIAFGHSDTPDTFGVILFDHQSSTGKWVPHVIDSGTMACEDLIIEDVTGDGKLDIIAGGRATHNLKLYRQR